MSKQIEDLVLSVIENKINKFSNESNYMPFLDNLVGKDRRLLYSFMHSLNTSLGMSVFEQVAEIIAKKKFPKVERQIKLRMISNAANEEINKIIEEINKSGESNKQEEVERLRKLSRKGKISETNVVKIDLLLEDKKGVTHLFDIKTTKPNVSDFRDYKQTLLKWTAMYLCENPDAMVSSYIAMPYNPYHPQPYERWTTSMLDLSNELKVGEDFWSFVGNKKTYSDLLKSFENAGKIAQPKIDQYIKQKF